MSINNNACLGEIYLKDNQYVKSIEWFENALEKEDIFDYYCYLGLGYFLLNEIETADYIWMSALLQGDDFYEYLEIFLSILNKVGAIKLQQYQFIDAVKIYKKIDNLLAGESYYESHWGLYYYHLGLSLEGLNDKNQAIKSYEKAIKINPHLVDAYNNLGNIYLSFNQLEQAEFIYREAIKVNTPHSGTYFNLYLTLKQLGKIEDAIALTKKAVELFPDDYGWQLRKNLFLPIIYRTEEEILFYRNRFTEGLNNLIENLDLSTELKRENALNAISNHTNFYLAYQGYNDIDLQKKYASLVTQITHSIFSYDKPIKTAKNGENKIKLGFVTGGSSNRAKWLLKWLEYLKGNTFTIYVYIIEDIKVNLKQNFEAVTDFCYCIPHNLKTVCDHIYQDNLDILTYTEIGMLPQTIVMASLKLAPIQCSTIGHPLTSGLETIDYYISRELMEISDAQNHYSEQLFCLPNIGMYLEEESFFTVNKCRSDFNLCESYMLYLCSQMLFKYLPQYDYLFAEIALQVSNAKFVFLESYPYLTRVFQDRLHHVFSQRNLNYQDYCLFLPSLSQNDYFNLNLLSDVFLDSLAWSGDNTTREAIASYLPVVTYPTELMRGRHSYGILKMLNIEETIANSEEEYISIAVRLGQDQNWRQTIKEKIKANIHLLYNDLECVRALETFYRDFCCLHK
ncbi:tetratricopeptide repeat protein [Cyanobacterium aponinum UTEX 3221]|uniref:O-linked N-acetylglucosamine transferase, SPINDLY family protein n=1 Tax=Cyanobacterium aponinum TaxID=379064 RepID=UPI000C12C624|nr:tetratricopeptide repeat protein [Cyanobacterium aponinum]PHV62811.1 O-linked N-acetylglucosamine transferase, SPINDLY family protein [Cyanobacterium aponinum IPPAS B-1201]WRL37717.1 tetratricopeptide repeat protein [Cyanobacterium aponinum UTEX 3221]